MYRRIIAEVANNGIAVEEIELSPSFAESLCDELAALNMTKDRVSSSEFLAEMRLGGFKLLGVGVSVQE